jgi:hypothetical protein
MKVHQIIVLMLFTVATLTTQSCKRQARKSKNLQTTENAQTTSTEAPAKVEKPQEEATTKEPVVVAIEQAKIEEKKVITAIKPIDFEWISGKSKVTIKDDKGDQNVNISVRMKKDSLIWLSAGLMGLEGVRALITQDSIKVLDRINKAVYFMDFNSLSKQFNFPLGFKTVQSILIGEMPFAASQMDLVLTEPSQSTIIRQDKGRVKLDNFLKAERLIKINMKEELGNAMSIDYADFQQVSATADIPFLISILIDYKKEAQPMQTSVSINHQRMEVQSEALTFPFVVPSNFKRK